MTKSPGYRSAPFTANRRVVAAAAAAGNRQNNIHSIIEVDIIEPRRLLREHRRKSGERLSLTAYIIFCLARTVDQFPSVNSFRKGRKLILLNDVTVSATVEREIDGERMPEIFSIHAAQTKTYRQIHDEIRSAQQNREDRLGALSGSTWIRFIPGFLLRAFVRAASRSIFMAKRFGKVGVTAVGMFGSGAQWFIPLSGGTVVVTVGGIVERPAFVDGRLEPREMLCLTVSFNHDIVDGAPAARFTKRLAELIRSGDAIREAIGGPPGA
jgi:pyruvate/2-oxoglutarate dehydrogenase complex dihydrolipoamide acyltransferase (E2) component